MSAQQLEDEIARLRRGRTQRLGQEEILPDPLRGPRRDSPDPRVARPDAAAPPARPAAAPPPVAVAPPPAPAALPPAAVAVGAPPRGPPSGILRELRSDLERLREEYTLGKVTVVATERQRNATRADFGRRLITLKQLRTQGASPDRIAEAQRAVAEAKSALNTLDDEFSQAKNAFDEFVQTEFKGTRIQLPPDQIGRVETVILDDPLGTGRFGLVARSKARPDEVVKVLVNRGLAIEHQEEKVLRILTSDLNAKRTPTPQQVRLLRRYMLEPETLPLAGPVDEALRELGIEPSRAKLLPRDIEKIKADSISGADFEMKSAFEGQKQGAAYLDKVNAELVKAGKEPIAYKRILSSGSDGTMHFLKLERVQTDLKVGPGGRYAERFIAGPLNEADQTAIALVQKQLADVRGAWADPNTGNVMLIDQFDQIDQTGQTLRRGGIIDTDRMGAIDSPEIVSWRQSYARAPRAYNINSLRDPRAVTDPAERLRIIEENATILSDPHRFALKQFEASGYIEFVPGTGYQQLRMDPRTIERVFDIDLNDPLITPPVLLRSSFELKLTPARVAAGPLWMKGWREAA